MTDLRLYWTAAAQEDHRSVRPQPRSSWIAVYGLMEEERNGERHQSASVDCQERFEVDHTRVIAATLAEHAAGR
jgi:hypothetical protein